MIATVLITATAATCLIGSGWVTWRQYLPSHVYLAVGLAATAIGVGLRIPAVSPLVAATPCGTQAVKHAAIAAAGACMILFAAPSLDTRIGRHGAVALIVGPPVVLLVLAGLAGPWDSGTDFLEQSYARPGMVPYWWLFSATTAVPLGCFFVAVARAMGRRLSVPAAILTIGAGMGFVWGLVTPTRWLLLVAGVLRPAEIIAALGKVAVLVGAAALIAALISIPVSRSIASATTHRQIKFLRRWLEARVPELMIPAPLATRRFQEPTEIADALAILQRRAPTGPPPATAQEMATALRQATANPDRNAANGQDWHEWASDTNRLAAVGKELAHDLSHH